MTHTGVSGWLDIVSLEILLTGHVFISIAQVSDSGVKKSLGEVSGGFTFPCTLKGLNGLKNACEGTIWKVSDFNLTLHVLGNLGALY